MTHKHTYQTLEDGSKICFECDNRKEPMKDKSKIKITVDGRRCLRCGHEWVPLKVPRQCPKCKSCRFDEEKPQ